MDAALSRFARLSELTALLADALSEEEVVLAVLDQGRDVLGASGGFVVLPTADRSELRLVGARGFAEAIVERWQHIPLEARVPAATAYLSGQSVVVDSVEQRDRLFPELAGGPLDERMSLTLPLRGRAGMLGSIGFAFGREAPLTEYELVYAEALADHCAVAIERSQLFAEAAAARAAAERSADRAALLQKVTADLAQARTPRRVAEVLVHEGVVAADAQGGWVSLLNRDGTLLELVAEAGFSSSTVERYGSLAADLTSAPTIWMHGLVPRWFESASAVVEAHPELRERHVESGFEAVAILPLVVRGRGVGFLAIDFVAPRAFADDERALLQTLATLCSQALERAQLYEELGARANAAAVLERIDEGVFQLDQNGRILIWNPAAARITGIAAEDALGRPIGLVLPDWDRVGSVEPERARESLRFELAGNELWLSFSAVRYPEGAVFAFRDLTGERALEVARRDFVATASHELRTPLSSVYGAARTLMRRTLGEARQAELLSLIVDEASRLSAILDELLLASSLDAGALTMQVVPCEAAALVRGVVELARERAEDMIELVFVDGAPGTSCLADPDRLRQVLVNLVDNAIKYSPGGGRVEVAVTAADGLVRIAVADRGLGIPAWERERIFEKFYRLDPSLTRGVGGTGLGLFICRQLVHGMGGRIGVDGRDGGGSVFAVELPAG